MFLITLTSNFPSTKFYFVDVRNEDKTDSYNADSLFSDPRIKLIVRVIDFYAPESSE
jgi:hypothetical protein